MATFSEARYVRILLKMKLSNYAWYNWSTIITEADGYAVLVHVKRINNHVKKVIAPVINSVSIKLEQE